MGRTVYIYTFEDSRGYPVEWTTINFAEAQEYAQTHNYKLIENTYEWVESAVLEDNTIREDETNEEEGRFSSDLN